MIKALSQFDPAIVPFGICPTGAKHTIFMSESVMLDGSVYIGPNTQLLGNVRLGKNVHIEGNTFIDGTKDPVVIRNNAKIEAFIRIIGNTIIGERCIIKSFALIENSVVFPNSEIGGEIVDCELGHYTTTYKSCVMHNSSCDNYCKLGAHINRTRMGNRVNAKYGDINLLDGIIGQDVNFSAGTTFYNFGGGEEKKKTLIGNGSFVGGKIIAPRHIGSNIYMAAGLTLREDIPDNTYVDPTGKFRPNEMQNDGNGHWVRTKREQK